MPELPEVNSFQRYFDETALHQKIVKVKVQDDKIIRNVSGRAFAKYLKGRTFTQSYRQGKYLFGILDNGKSVLLHFGMTGDLKYYSEEEDQPKHERFHFDFGNGFKLGFDCPRKFARILYLEDYQEYIASVNLGEDALRIKEKDFLEKLKGKKASIKGFLLNQKQLAGVGNLYADEICFRTKIHPASKVDQLSAALRKKIYHAMIAILQFGVDRNATYGQYPDDWLWHYRKEGIKGPKKKGIMQSATIAGRTTYWSEGYQKKY